MAEDEDESGKTEEPSAKKLEDARERGEVITSREVNHWFMMMAAALFIMTFAGKTGNSLMNELSGLITNPQDIAASTMPEISEVLIKTLKIMIIALAVPMVIFLVAAIAGTVLQIGPMWAPDHLMPKLERVSIMSGFGRLFSKRNLLEFIKGLLKITIVGVIVSWIMWPFVPTIGATMDEPPPLMLTHLKTICLRVLMGMISVLMVIAVLDYLLQRLMFMNKMRMSRNEMKEEHKQSEGDPHIKQRIRQIRMERARRRMMSEVPRADVIVTNPDHFAIALEYKPPKHSAPIVVAMGADLVAQKIKEIARENNIPIVENPPLARALFATADLEKEIPTEHYKAVAEIISYVFKLKNKMKR